MNINANKIGIASAITFGLLWAVCSAVVHLLPQPMMMITGHMIHSDLSELGWNLTFSSFLMGLVAWAALAGISGWLIASIYNRI
jgi:hypothetical protein